MSELVDHLKPLLQLADAVIITDKDHRIIAVNEVYEQITGYSSEEIIGKKASILRTSFTPCETHRDMKHHIHNGLPWSGVFTNRKKNKNLWHSSITITPYHIEGTIYFVGVFRELEQLNSGFYLPEERVSYIQGSILRVLAISCEIRDPGIEQHLLRVKELTEELTAYHNNRLELQWNPDTINQISNSSILHDIGKSAIPEGILYKPGKLAPYERQIVEMHTQIGCDIIDKIYADFNDELFATELEIAKNIIKHHHEKWDGTGYPQRLARENIPVEARIVSVVDVYDALTSARPYKEKWPIEKALDYIRMEKGKHFDTDIADSFLEMMAYKMQEQAI